MDHEKQRQRYLAGAEGAPPVPPPGGYRGAKRQQGPVFAPGGPLPLAAAPAPVEKKPSSVFARIALIVAIVFASVLLIVMLAGGADLLYGLTLFALQLLVAGLVVAALCTARGRMLGAIALVITLLFNVATVGALGALVTSARGSYDGVKSDEQKHEEAYPGIKDENPQNALDQQSVEEIRAASDALFADIRARLTAEFGYEWVPVGDETLRPERNGYGGESMLVEYASAGWATTEPIQDYDRKVAVMDLIGDIVNEHGMYGLYAFNDPLQSGIDPTIIAKMYGSDDVRTQHTWEAYSDNYPEPMRFYADIYDLSNDDDGSFTRTREAQSARTGEPVEGLQFVVIASAVLSEADREEFEKRLEEYPGFY
ncbi:hypothetical protein [Microbacterium sp.]|uniref:hypothetical protein n=1 Tax=Microbacterium sp. TaxID=51671 RepID=UPI0039E32378